MQSYKHFTTGERACLAEYVLLGRRPSQIARILGRSVSSITRELKRNSNRNGRYNPAIAENRYKHRRRTRCVRKPRLGSGSELFTFVCEKLKATWSPEQIVLVWKAAHLGERLSVDTIYRDVKKGRLPGIAAKTHLRRRGKRKYGKRSKFNGVQPTHTIHERPQTAEGREEVGHWEGDTVEGKNHRGRFATFIDRRLRVGVAAKMDSKSADDLVKATIRALRATGLPVRTITLDNGAEMAKYKEIEKALETTVYFADPRSPGQRGTNENYNGQLRFFFPRGMDLRGVSEDELASAVSLINDRPRKCLGLRSPTSLAQELLHLH